MRSVSPPLYHNQALLNLSRTIRCSKGLHKVFYSLRKSSSSSLKCFGLFGNSGNRECILLHQCLLIVKIDRKLGFHLTTELPTVQVTIAGDIMQSLMLGEVNWGTLGWLDRMFGSMSLLLVVGHILFMFFLSLQD